MADTHRAVRVCETSHPPVYYVPRDDVAPGVLERGGAARGASGRARRPTGTSSSRAAASAGIAWSYEDPSPGLEHLRGAVAFYPGAVDRALVDGEHVRPQPGGFYGGWITSDVVGPFKGAPGTLGW